MSENLEAIVSVGSDISGIERAISALANLNEALAGTADGGNAAFLKVAAALQALPADFERVAATAVGSFGLVGETVGVLEANLVRLDELSGRLALGGGLNPAQLEETLALLQRVAAAEAELRAVTGGSVTGPLVAAQTAVRPFYTPEEEAANTASRAAAVPVPVAATAEVAEVQSYTANLARLNAAIDKYVPVQLLNTEEGEAVRSASARLVAAEERFTASLLEGTLAQQASAAAAKINAEASLTRAVDNAGGAAGGGGGLAGGLGDFASVAKYLLLYQAFILTVRGAKDAFDQTVELQRAITNLSIATAGGSINASEFADQLGRIGTAAGLSDAAAVTAATQFIRAFPDANQTAAGKAGANVASTLNVIGDPKTVAQDTQSVVSILSSFNLGIENTTRILDAATASAQAFGLAGPNSILPGVAQISDLAAASGFTVEQTTATVAAIILRTGESSDAAAGELRRFLGREGNSAFQKVFQDFGVDTRQNFEQELQAFAPIFQNLGQQQRAAVIGQLGGGRAGAAVEAILGDYKRVQDVANAPIGGAAAAQETKRLADLKGLLTTLGGDFKQLAVDVGNSGIGVLFGVALQALDPLLKGLDEMLSIFNELPGPVREVALGLAEVAALLAVIGRESEAGLFGNILAGGKGLLGKVGIGGGGAAAAETFIGPAGETIAVDAAAGGAGLAAGGAAVSGALLPAVGIAVGGLLAIGEFKNRSDALAKAVDDAKTATTALGDARTADDFKAAASAFGKAAKEVPTGFFTDLFGFAKQAGAAQGSDKSLAAFSAQEAARLAAEAAQTSGQTGASVFGTGGNVDIAAGFAYLHTAGLSAQDALHQLGLLLKGVADDAASASARLTGSATTLAALSLAATNNKDVTGVLNTLDPGSGGTFQRRGVTQGSVVPTSTFAQTNPHLQQEIDKGFLQGVQTYADANGITGSTAITPDIATALQAAGIQQALAAAKAAGLDPAGLRLLALSLSKSFADNLQRVTSGLAALQTGKGLSAAVAAQIAGNLDQFMKDTISAIDALHDPGQRARLAAQLLAASQQLVAQARASGNPEEVIQAQNALNSAQDEVIKIEAANAQQIIDHLKATGGDNARTRAQILAVSRQLILDAAAAGNTDAVIAAMNGLTQSAIQGIDRDIAAAVTAAIAARNAALNIVNAAIQAAQAARAAGLAGPGGQIGDAPVGGSAASDLASSNAALAKLLAEQKTLQAATKYAAPSGSDFSFPKAKGGGGGNAAKKAGELAAAIIEANAISGDQLSEDIAAVRAAQAKIQDYKKGSVEWYGAIKALKDAQFQLATLYLQLANDKLLLAGDVTDPLVTARAKVAADLAKLAFDQKRGANTVADSLQLRQDQAAAEKAAFDQKFSDEQTAYQLNQISYQSYLNYLQSQHDLLTAVKKKTRDQIDELNQVDQALQSAQQQLAGQFNIGAISLPTIYEVRRSIAASTGPLNFPGGGGGQTTTNTFYITGTDTGAVKKVIESVLGPTASATRTVAGRK